MASKQERPGFAPIQKIPDPGGDDLAAAKADLAALPGLIQSAVDEGREEDLSHLLARRSILEARVDRARNQVDTDYLDALRAYVDEAQATYEATAAEQAPIAREARERLAASDALVHAARVAVVNARYELERVETARPDSWWLDQGMLPPGAPPTADKVIGEFELSQVGKAYRRDHGRGVER